MRAERAHLGAKGGCPGRPIIRRPASRSPGRQNILANDEQQSGYAAILGRLQEALRRRVVPTSGSRIWNAIGCVLAGRDGDGSSGEGTANAGQ